MKKLHLILLLPALQAVGLTATPELRVYPPVIQLQLEGAQSILVTAIDSNGVGRDVTSEATLRVENPRVASIEKPNSVTALTAGETRLQTQYDGMAAAAKVVVGSTSARRDLSFVNDVVPVLTKSGCANSNCHGSVRGQNGFKLSLFGYDPEMDYEAITEKSDGRRIDLDNPEDSLLIRKPTFQVAHGGGQRFEVGSYEHETLLKWLRDGARFDQEGGARIASLEVYPRRWHMVGIGTKLGLLATAEYSDGTIRDVTHIVQYSSNIPEIGSLIKEGIVKAERVGETAIMVRTMGLAKAVEIMVVEDPPRRDYPRVSRTNYVDDFVFDKLRKMNVIPSELSSDEEFVRRVYLDTIGVLPTVEETRAFLESKEPDKRAALIDELLERPERDEFWAMRFADMFRAGYNEAGQKGGGAFYRWFRDQVRQDVPYDEMVRKLLLSLGRHDFEGISNFYFVSREIDPEESGVNVSQLLLGVQLECARCHDHPFEKWTQGDFYGLAAFFARVERKNMYRGNHNATYLKEEGEVIHPKTEKPVQPKYLDGPVEVAQPGKDMREKLAEWITKTTNPFFARATVNRIWKFYMGRGLVEPVDDFRVTNPPTNAALLNALASDFAEGRFSLKHLERRILNSRTYQLSSATNETNGSDQINYSHYLVRRLTSEQLIDSMVQVTGVTEKFPSFPLGTRAMAVAVLPYQKPHYMMKLFGRNELREVICERETKPSVTQVMHMISGDTLQKKLTAKDGNLKAWLNSSMTDRELVEHIYWAALSRFPSEIEVEASLEPIIEADPTGDVRSVRRRAFEDLLWAVLNSKEFIFNH